MTCAYAVRGALKKFPQVESVEVSLNKGLATVKLKPGNTIRPQQFWEAILKNGFTPKDTHVIVRGELFSAAGKTQFKVAGTNQVCDLIGDLTQHQAEKQITIIGVIRPPKDFKSLVPLRVTAVEDSK